MQDSLFLSSLQVTEVSETQLKIYGVFFKKKKLTAKSEA